jgi:hypothetical protein
MGPARGMPVPPIIGSPERRIGRPYHQMCGTGTYFVIATGATVGLDGTGCRDGTDVVFMTVGPDFHPAERR